MIPHLKAIWKKRRSSNRKGNDMICFKLKKPDHVRADCLKGQFKRSNAMCATWMNVTQVKLKIIPMKKKNHLYILRHFKMR